jgi:hypothetical protein
VYFEHVIEYEMVEWFERKCAGIKASRKWGRGLIPLVVFFNSIVYYFFPSSILLLRFDYSWCIADADSSDLDLEGERLCSGYLMASSTLQCRKIRLYFRSQRRVFLLHWKNVKLSCGSRAIQWSFDLAEAFCKEPCRTEVLWHQPLSPLMISRLIPSRQIMLWHAFLACF